MIRSVSITTKYVLPILLFLCLSACNPKTSSQTPESRTSLVVAETARTVTCRLPDGNTSILPKHPKRTVILLTSLLDLWVETGGEVVARCNGDLNVPPETRSAPVVGSFNNPNIEKIIALEPDLVLSSDVGNFRAIIPILEQNRIAYAFFNYVNYHDYVHILELFSKINGAEEKFKQSWENMTGEVNRIVRMYETRTPPRVLVVFTTSNSVSCELPNSQIGVMLSMLGARNIIPSTYQGSSKTRIDFSLERIVELDPDIILLNTMGEVEECRDRLRREFESNAAWSSLRAIKNGRFHVLPKAYFLYKPNSDFPKALRYLAGILYENAAPKMEKISPAEEKT